MDRRRRGRLALYYVTNNEVETGNDVVVVQGFGIRGCRCVESFWIPGEGNVDSHTGFPNTTVPEAGIRGDARSVQPVGCNGTERRQGCGECGGKATWRLRCGRY